MTTSNVKITASVIEPLLTQALVNRTVARMNNGETFGSIEIATNDDFIDYVCSLGGLDPLSLGADRKNGINRQVIYAERTLRRKGVCRKCGRGRYGLAVAPTDGVTVEPKPVVNEPVNEPVSEPQVQVMSKVGDDLLYPRPSAFADVGIFADPHFRNIAIAQSKCFGRFSSDKRSACGDCPLAQFCFEKLNLDLQAFAVKFEKAQNEPQPSAEKPKAQSSQSSQSSSKSKSKSNKIEINMSGNNARIVTAQLSAKCSHCGGDIKSGDQTIWAPGKGTYHFDCVEQV